MIESKTWEEFRDSKLLWWINRLLHTFGWVIVYDIDENGSISSVYPAKTSYRGFSEKSDEEGFSGFAEFLTNEFNKNRG